VRFQLNAMHAQQLATQHTAACLLLLLLLR
jgi:hypothetical protein